MKKKTILLLALMCVLMLTADMQAAAAKADAGHTAEYAEFGVTVKGKAYYYGDGRIRIFHDMRADHSFENSFVDRNGTVDVRLLRGKSGAITALELIPKAEANEILEDLYGYVPSSPAKKPQGQDSQKEKAGKKDSQKEQAGKTGKKDSQKEQAEKGTATGTKAGKGNEYTDIKRCSLDDVPAGVADAISRKCTGNGWYVVKTGSRQYVYCSSLPRDYAFRISGKKLNVRDIGRRTGIYVLLSIGNDLDFTLSYNSKAVSFTTVDVN